MVDENLIERKKRLEEELDKKVSDDYREFIDKSNEYLKKTKEKEKNPNWARSLNSGPFTHSLPRGPYSLHPASPYLLCV